MDPAWLDELAAGLDGSLTTSRLGRSVRVHPTVDSTMNVAGAWARDGAPHGGLVLAATQTEGRGRLGRAWHDQPGASLLCSVILRSSETRLPSSLLPLAAGVAVATAIQEASERPALLKWPNDVMVNRRKVAGLLIEGSGEAFVLGLGVNLRHGAVPPELAHAAVSLEEAAGAMVEPGGLLASFLNSLEPWVDGGAGGGDALMAAWEARMYGRGEAISVTAAAGGDRLVGVARGLAPDGALRVETDGGERTVYAGDVTLGTPA